MGENAVIVVFGGERIKVTVKPVDPDLNARIAFADCFVEHLQLAFSDRKEWLDAVQSLDIKRGSPVFLERGPYVFSGTKTEVNLPMHVHIV